jgi:hypothetical protein
VIRGGLGAPDWVHRLDRTGHADSMRSTTAKGREMIARSRRIRAGLAAGTSALRCARVERGEEARHRRALRH